MLTHQPGQPWRAVVPVLPDCTAEASTRQEVLAKIQECIQEVVQHTEILQIEVQAMPKNGNLTVVAENGVEPASAPLTTPWHFFGIFQNDPQWGQIFEEIEQEREQNLIGD